MTRIFRLMLAAAGPYAPQLRTTIRLCLAACLVQAAAYATFIPLLMELTRNPVRTDRAWTWVAVLAGLVALEAALRVREGAFTYDYWHLITRSTRLRLGAALRSMPQQELARRAAGDLASVVGANATTAAGAVSTLSTLFVQIVAVPAVLGIVIAVVDVRLGLVLLAATVAVWPLVRRVQQRSNAGFATVDEADARLSDRIVEYVQGLPVLKAVGQAGAHSTRLAPALEHQHRAQRETHRSAALPTLAAQLLVHLTLVVLVIVGAALALGAHLSPATLCALVVAAARLAEPLSMATVMTKLFEQAQAALRRVEDVLAVEPLPVAPGGRPPANFEVVFEDVTFAYDEHDRPALRAVSLTLPERSLTALVGPSGSGKTTISKLITRYADPHRGTVRLGGVDLRTLPPDEILRHVGVVFQDVYLFDDTIRANIALARPEAADAEVEQAARAANIHEFIAGLPAGYGTRVGEIGAALSGGERQRISIARAILKDAPVILLDEPTAALDAESEVAVQQAIARLVSGKTVLVIAHRLSTVVGADQILVLEDGAIVQRGTHAQLLADPESRYARMWAAQGAARDWHLAASRALGRWGTSPSRSSAAGLAES